MMADDDLFTWYPNLTALEAANDRLFSDYGYPGRAQNDGLTVRFFDPVPHPDGPADGFLAVVKDIWHHGEGRRKSADEMRLNHLTAGERGRIKTRVEWKALGFFPKPEA